jgi:hypothetical protein
MHGAPVTVGQSRDLSTGALEAGGKSGPNRISRDGGHDRRRARRFLDLRDSAVRDEHVDVEPHELCGQFLESFGPSCGVPPLDHEIFPST